MWEEVADTSGRTYFWNTTTNEVSWEKPLKYKEKTDVKSKLYVEKDSVKLALVLSQPKNKIINKIWNDLSFSQRETRDLEKIFKTNVIKIQIVYALLFNLKKWFHVWEKNSKYISNDNFCLKSALFYRWVEIYKHKEVNFNLIKKLMNEKQQLLAEIANLKVEKAQQNFTMLKIKTKKL